MRVGNGTMEELIETTLVKDVEDLEAITVRLGWITRRRLDQELEQYHLTVPQLVALRCIQENEQGCNMSELAESARQVSATMTGIIDRLVDRGLVERTRDPRDRRSLRVVLTPQGKELLEKVSAHKRAWLREFFQTLSPEERRLMIDMAHRYLVMVESGMNLG
jgi:DNA-binding MarR family transcriptional regulator